MALTENPVDIVATLAAGQFKTGDHTLLKSYADSFYIPTTAEASVRHLTDFIGDAVPPLYGYGQATSGSSTTDQIGLVSIGGLSTGLVMLYIEAQLNAFTGQPVALGAFIAAASTPVSFPVGTLPLAVLTLDQVGRIQAVTDSRGSGLSSAPTIGAGGLSEVVSDATKRFSFMQNFTIPRTYSLSATIRPQLDLPASGFTLGGGTVNVTGIGNVTTASTYWSAASNFGPNPPIGWKQLQVNATNQLFVSATTGQLSTQIAVTSGVFPTNSLALCEVVTDNGGLIRAVNSFKPSYI